MSRQITVAIHTYDKAVALSTLLKSEGIAAELQNVNLETPGVFSGVRVRIPETDLPLALRIIENKELFAQPTNEGENMRTVLVPVDLSEKSFKAAMVGAHIAAEKGARIRFLHSYLDPTIAGKVQFTDSLSYDSGDHDMSLSAREHMERFADRFRDALKKGEAPVVKYDYKVVEGVPEDSIVDFAKNELPFLIVMGTRGAERKAREMIGSVTAEVLDEGRFTILTVPEPVEAEKSLHPANILFMSNLDQDDILAMDTVYRLFGRSAAKVTIMHIPHRRRFSDTSAGKAMQRLADYCASNFPQYRFITVPVLPGTGEKEFGLLQEEESFDLIVVPNRRRNAFSRLFNPGLANKILLQADIPMLLIPV